MSPQSSPVKTVTCGIPLPLSPREREERERVGERNRESEKAPASVDRLEEERTKL